MKKYLKFIAFVSLVCTIVSCDDYLDTKSNSTFTEDKLFTNLDFATKTVNGIYVNFTTGDMYDYFLGLFYKCDNDIECHFMNNDGGKNSLSHYAGDAGNSTTKAVWNTIYRTIERANICIDNLPKSPIWAGEDADEAKRLYGEAITLRAHLYYELINTWGDVPFKIKSSQAGDNFNLPKTDRDSIYEYLIQDLKDVENYVPWMTETRTAERVNKGFVKGLRARLALAYAGYSLRNKTLESRRGRKWQEYYEIANQECKEIMASGKHQLNPSFINIFKTMHTYSQDLTYREVLFEVANARLYAGRVARQVGMQFCSQPADPKYGGAAGEIKMTPTYYYSFDRNDARRNVSVEMFNYASPSFLSKQRLVSYSSFNPCKWRRSWIVPLMGGELKTVVFTGVNWPLMRYSDVVLMFAESENEINGPTVAAKEALSSVRQRAFPENAWATKVTHYVDSVSVSKESFFNAVVDERAWEFGGEFLRKNDLVRWNLLGTKLRKVKEDCQKIIHNDPSYENYAKVPDYIFWKYKDDNETLDILNPDYRLPDAAIVGYTRTSWMPVFNVSSQASFTTVMDIVANGYVESKNNHLYHIAADIITASNGVLSNDQIP